MAFDDEDDDYRPRHGGGDRKPDDCLNCGVCGWCIERSIAAAEDWEPEKTTNGEG